MSGDDAGGWETGLPGVVLVWRFASSPGGQGSTLQEGKKNLIKYVNTVYRRQSAFQLALFRPNCIKLSTGSLNFPVILSFLVALTKASQEGKIFCGSLVDGQSIVVVKFMVVGM